MRVSTKSRDSLVQFVLVDAGQYGSTLVATTQPSGDQPHGFVRFPKSQYTKAEQCNEG